VTTTRVTDCRMGCSLSATCSCKMRCHQFGNEQDAAIARALHEDDAHRQADLHEVAQKEAEAVPDRPPGL